MVKARTNISIESELLSKAQEAQLNVSGLTESAIKNKLNIKEIMINESLRCEFCGTEEGIQETLNDVKLSERRGQQSSVPNSFIPTAYSDKSKLIWIYPDERWICNACLMIKIKSVSVSHL